MDFIENFGLRLMYVWETGLVPYWVQNVIPKAYACFDKNQQKTTSKPNAIKLVDLTSAFLILGVGLGLGIIFFIFEIMHYRLIRRFRVKNPPKQLGIKINAPEELPDVNRQI